MELSISICPFSQQPTIIQYETYKKVTNKHYFFLKHNGWNSVPIKHGALGNSVRRYGSSECHLHVLFPLVRSLLALLSCMTIYLVHISTCTTSVTTTQSTLKRHLLEQYFHIVSVLIKMSIVFQKCLSMHEHMFISFQCEGFFYTVASILLADKWHL